MPYYLLPNTKAERKVIFFGTFEKRKWGGRAVCVIGDWGVSVVATDADEVQG